MWSERSEDPLARLHAVEARSSPASLAALPPYSSARDRLAGLSPEEVAACESGRSVPGVSSSRIREAIDGRVPVMVQDPGLLLGANATEALRGRPCSVLCAPMCDPRTGRALAVLYVQNHGVKNAFGEIDRAWIEVYARALGRCLASMRERHPAAETTPS